MNADVLKGQWNQILYRPDTEPRKKSDGGDLS
jgi:hypothetical protein